MPRLKIKTFIFLLVFFINPAVSEEPSLLVLNPSFELPGIASQEATYWDVYQGTCYVQTAYKYYESWALRCNSAANGARKQTVDLTDVTEVTVWAYGSSGPCFLCVDDLIDCEGGGSGSWQKITHNVSALSGNHDVIVMAAASTCFFDLVGDDYIPDTEILWYPDVETTNESDLSLEWTINNSDWALPGSYELEIHGYWWNDTADDWQYFPWLYLCDSIDDQEGTLDLNTTDKWGWLFGQNKKVKLYAELQRVISGAPPYWLWYTMGEDTIIYDPAYNYTYEIPPEEVLPNSTMTPVPTPTLDTGVINETINNTLLQDYYNNSFDLMNQTNNNLNNSSNFLLRPIIAITDTVNEVNSSLSFYSFTTQVSFLGILFGAIFGSFPVFYQALISLAWVGMVIIVIFHRRD